MTMEVSNINESWIYQSNKLIESSYTLTVIEQKLIRLLASMIKKDDDDFKEYEFKTKELIKILNTSDSRFYRDIDNITDLVMQRIIKIKDKATGSWEKYHWVDTAKYSKGILKLKIHRDLKPFYLSLDWYSKYQLKNIMQFKSTYSFRLYELFKQYQTIGSRIISIQELRSILDIGKTQYTKYANLKQKVLSIALREINSNTDLCIECTEIKKVRKVESIKFLIKGTVTEENIEEEACFNESENIMPKLRAPIPLRTLEKAISGQNTDEVNNIMTQHNIVPSDALKILNSAAGDLDLIKNVYSYALKQNIDNVVGYMISMVRPGVFQEPKTHVKKNNFTDYEQRDYNFDMLERKLLGWDKDDEKEGLRK